MQSNALLILYGSLVVVLPALTIRRSFIILKAMTEDKNKRHTIILVP